MTNYKPNVNHMNTTAFPKPTGFKIMFGIVSTFIALTFAAVIVFMVMFFTGNAPYSYHYEVNYGNGNYSETETFEVNP